MNLRKELRDQAAHAAAGFIILAPLAIWPGQGGVFILAAALVGLVRETTKLGDPVTPAKIWHALTHGHDLVGWIIGGALATAFLSPTNG
mgnify:CR=1 FL=1